MAQKNWDRNIENYTVDEAMSATATSIQVINTLYCKIWLAISIPKREVGGDHHCSMGWKEETVKLNPATVVNQLTRL